VSDPQYDAASAPRTVLAVRGASKRFGATQALDAVSLELRAGEVHALVGGNGCGKSTLIKCLAGVYRADAGELEVRGEPLELSSLTPDRSRQLGLRFVHQDLGIFPELSLTENLVLGRGFETARSGRVRWRQSHRRARAILARFGLDLNPRQMAGGLSVPQRAMLAIARALQDEDEGSGGLLFLDEPTAALPATQVNLLLEAIRELARSGHAVVMVTHRLDEVRDVADRVTAFRDGRYVDTVAGRGLTEGDLVELILGRRLSTARTVNAPNTRTETVLAVDHLRGGPLRDVSFAVRAGDVVGLAGLLGSGRTELLKLIYGLLPLQDGTVELEGVPIATPRPRDMCRRGVAFLPESRVAEAVFPASSVRENLVAGHEGRYFRGLWLRDRQAARETDADVRRFQIRTESARAMIESLSGGNQQKVVLARWLRQSPRLLLLDEPTQGVDVGARDEIYALISAAADSGCGVVIVSSEFEELARICGRVLVLSGGRIVNEQRQPMHAHELLELSIGQREVAA
jgi:ribose transport system ATP-binding protein